MRPDRDLRGLSEASKARLAASLGKLSRQHEEQTFNCPECKDTGYVSSEMHGKGGKFWAAKPCQGSGVVFCRLGTAIEAGNWSQVLKAGPRVGSRMWLGQTIHLDGKAVLDAYARRLRAHPHGLELRAIVDRILGEDS